VATSSALPSSPAASQPGAPVAPPNFYAQAATAQPPASTASKGNPEDTATFRKATEKLLTIFDKMEKLKPNGIAVDKKIKSMAQALKDLRSEVFEGEEGDDSDTDLGPGGGAGGAGATGQTNAASPPPTAPGGVAGTGA
jgi:hypothetical protein